MLPPGPQSILFAPAGPRHEESLEGDVSEEDGDGTTLVVVPLHFLHKQGVFGLQSCEVGDTRINTYLSQRLEAG